MRYAARVLLLPLRAYQRLISPLLGSRCRYHPTCSQYAIDAIGRFGGMRGIYLAARRLLRCHPWSPGGFDHVPESFSWRRRDEAPVETETRA